MHPLTLVRISKGKKISLSLRNGDTYEGVLIKCDLNMNVNLFNVVVTTERGSYFYAECFVKGSFVRSFRIKNSVMDVQEKMERRKFAVDP